MNYIVISPYYPQNFQQFTIELAKKGSLSWELVKSRTNS